MGTSCVPQATTHGSQRMIWRYLSIRALRYTMQILPAVIGNWEIFGGPGRSWPLVGESFQASRRLAGGFSQLAST